MRPLGVSSQDAVDEMSVLVEENDDVVALHEAGPVRGLGEIADQDIFGKPKACFASGQSERGVVLVFVFARKHVEVNPADAVVLVVDVIHGHFRMPDLASKPRACR